MDKKYPSTREIIFFLGTGFLLLSSIVAPGAAYIAKEIVKAKNADDRKRALKEWKKFNLPLLRRNLKRLREQKVIKIIKEGNDKVLVLTTKGKAKYLRLALENLSQKGTKWDGRWRIIIYDISKFRKKQQERFRSILKKMNFLRLQKSVYITPYSCEEQILYLREYFNIGEEVLLLRADKIENEAIYRDYFGV